MLGFTAHGGHQLQHADAVGNLRLGCQRNPRYAGYERDALDAERTGGHSVDNRVAGGGRG